MTIEETIEKLEFMKRAYQELRDASITNGIVSGNAGEIKGEWHSDGRVLEEYQKYIDALEMAINALDQEPCEDAINRETVLKLQYRIDDSTTLSTRDVVNVEDIEDLPSVTPKEKTGHWISRNSFLLQYRCSECGRESEKYNFCPDCGAKMVEPQERRDKE